MKMPAATSVELAPASPLADAGADGPGSVRLADVHKWFGEVEAVAGIDLEVRAGEFVSILGPSGSGKTTTMRIIGGFEHPDQGSVWLGGRDVTPLSPHRRNVNTVFQSYALFPHMTVQRNVEYGLKVAGVKRGERRARAAAALALVQLADVGSARPHQLSGGMRQRVALARALVNRPGVLLLDEPLGALDRKLREEMQIELRHLQREVGITFIYVTHDQEEALGMSDRLTVMRDGRIEQVGTPADVYDNPATLWVAGFVGASNAIAGTVHAAGREIEVDIGEGLLTGARTHTDLHPGDRVHVTVRPEHVLVGPPSRHGHSGEPGCRLSTRVEEVQNVGTSVRYVVVTPSGNRLQALEQRLSHRPPVALGDEVEVSWHAESAHAYGELTTTNKERIADGAD
jgi:spermidine/putrescine ABC transporter ATP-binding subunit